MKYAGVFFVFVAALMLTSCSSLDQENPTTVQMQKSSVTTFVYPYAFMTEFQSVPVKDYFTFNDAIRVTVPGVPFKVEQMFALIEYLPSPDMDYSVSTLLFLGNPNAVEFTIPVLGDKNIVNVEVFALPQRNIPDLVTNFPYDFCQDFDKLNVNNWSASGKNIKISCDDAENVNELFAEIFYKAGKVIVYLGQPENTTFEIPAFGDMGVTSINLFGYSGPEDYRTASVK
ncbi:MAG: hypothetical protein IPM56_01580 [Ignavibacteriales bacterium]|nr:MAG: hypothetical protein IPM56_01580 [Ignavibacteriales bacterium]